MTLSKTDIIEFYRRFYGEYILGKGHDEAKPTAPNMRTLDATTTIPEVWSHPANAIDVSGICPDQIDGLEEWDYGSG